MRISFRLGILVVCLLAPSIAAAEDSGWYLGGGAGPSHASKPAPLYSQTAIFRGFEGATYSSDSGNQDSTAIRLEGGYWFTSHVGVQLSDVDLGHYTHFARSTVERECQFCPAYGLVESARAKAHGVTLVVTGRWPMSGSVELIGRAGLFRSRVTYSEDDNFASGIYHIKSSNTSPTAGLSFGWNLNAYWEALLGFDEYFGIGDYKNWFPSFNVTVVSLGVQYHF